MKQLAGWVLYGVLLAIAVVLPAGTADAATFTVLHDFAGGPDDGADPNERAKPASDGVRLYGVTQGGGDDDSGVVYAMNLDGTGFTLLHEFDTTEGGGPDGQLLLDGTRLYGATDYGGAGNEGTLFAIDTDGTDFAILRDFSGGTTDGSSPVGALTLDGTTLYGMTSSGGTSGEGTIYSIETDGTGFTLLHEFAGGTDDGEFPLSGLVLSGTILFGTASFGGDVDGGIVFSIETDGTGYTVLHEFLGGVGDGFNPRGGLFLDGTTLYGMTDDGGAVDDGTIYSIGTDGTGFNVLHEFDGTVDGKDAEGTLILDGKLYGMAEDGGATDGGIIFCINLDGTDFTVLHEFNGPTDGDDPEGSLVAIGALLYGVTNNGGADDDEAGTVFSFDPTPAQVPISSPGSLSVLFVGLLLALGLLAGKLRGRLA